MSLSVSVQYFLKIEPFLKYFKWNSSQGKKNIVSKVDFILSSLKEYVLKKGREEESYV